MLVPRILEYLKFNKLKWFKKKECTLPEDKVCRNCGAQTVGRYCHECGQDLLTGVGKPILKLIAQILDNVFALEGKTPRTLACLLVRPGFLPEEYRMGKIIRYVHPVKLFWMSSLIFFALLFSQMNIEDNQHNTTNSKEILKIEYSTKPSSTDTDTLTNDSTDDAEKTKELEEEFSAFFTKYVLKYAPYATFLLIPVFALLLAGFFRREKLFYMFHLVFAVHFHAFVWIYWSMEIAIGMIIKMFVQNVKYPDWLSFLILLIPGAYLSISFHRFYHTKSWWQAIRKTIGITAVYFLLILVVTVFLAILMVQLFFPEIANS